MKTMLLFILSLVVNCAIVFPVAWAMLGGSPGMDAAFGNDSDARRILASVYLGIGLFSLAGLVALALGHAATALPMIAGLLAVQIAYKLITMATVGIASPVVMTNVAVVVLHAAALTAWARS